MRAPLPRAARWLLAVGERLTPAHRRAAWRRQWAAEVEHRRRDPSGGLTALAWGSVRHALYLKREETTMRGWTADLRHSVRALLKRPAFTALAVATLAIGIGCATAIFSLAETLVLRPLPLEDGDRLVRIFSTNRIRGLDRFSVSHPDYVAFTSRSDLFSSSSFYSVAGRDLSGGGDPERIQVISVGERYFQTLGTPPLLGRVFGGGDHSPSSATTAVLGEDLWIRRFGADTMVVGRTVRLDGVPHTVVGVVPDGFAWPPTGEVWVPLQWGDGVPTSVDARANHMWQVVGRLRPGVDVQDASNQLRAMSRAIYLGDEIDERERDTEALAVPLRSSDFGEGTGAFFATLGTAVFLVLLIACMNASGLLFTRAWSRTRELSLRSALGAGRSRIVWILMGESAVLALLGGALGVGLGHLALTRAFAMAPSDITAVGDVRLNGSVLVGALVISLLAALLAGLIPARSASRISLTEALKEGSAQASAGLRGTRLRKGLVTTEIALSLALLVCAGLAVRGFQRQLATDPGFDASNLLSFTVRLPAARYAEDALVDAYYAAAVDRLERLPAIRAATTTSRLPLGAGGYSLGRSFIFDGATPPPEGPEYFASWVEVDTGYFETLGVQASVGRVFMADDRGNAPLVAVVNERLARRMSPGEPIVGRRIRSVYDENLPRTVVGVVPDLQFNGVSRAARQPVVFVPRSQAVRPAMAFLVRTLGDPSEMIPLVRREMAELDTDVALDDLQTLAEAHQADLAGIRFLTSLFATFGALALVLAVSGVYGLVSYSVSQRTQEIGVRIAMGATLASVGGAVIRESATLAAIGLTIGLGLGYVGGRVLASGMDGVATLQASTYVGATLVLAVAVLAASWFPAMRATGVDPVEALRSE